MMAKRSGSFFSDYFYITRDKTTLQRKLLRSYHEKRDQRNQAGKRDLRIYFENGLPKIGSISSKNEIFPREQLNIKN